MNYYLKSSLVLGVLGTLVYGEVQGESQQHEQYIAVSPGCEHFSISYGATSLTLMEFTRPC